MNGESLLTLWRDALAVTAQVTAPFLLAMLAVGLVVAVLQAATQLQESVLSFAPKLVAALLVAWLAGHWMLERLQRYAVASFARAAENAREQQEPRSW
ncbi:MAG: flagellar biosynthetic protein FliQ [Myxococcales bacterium]|nr:flagellar biosynthetic protein FliQ [Myxococcales bacterium]